MPMRTVFITKRTKICTLKTSRTFATSCLRDQRRAGEPLRSDLMRASISILFLSGLALLAAFPAAQTAKTLDVYVIDVEGGNAGLYVSPSGESVLIDSGNGGTAAARDADRIMAAVRDAGVKQIEHPIT